jgi:hypothetical protein
MAAGSSQLMMCRAEAATLDFVGNIIQNAGSVIKNIADGIEASYKTGTFIVDDQKKRSACARLRQIGSVNNMLILGQSPLLLQIDNYKLGSVFWPQLQTTLARVAVIIQSATMLLNDLAPDLPPSLSEQISQLASLYAGRGLLADEFRSLPEPKTEADVDALKNLGTKWTGLWSAPLEADRVTVSN